MVVMQMCQHDILNVFGRDPKQRQRLNRAAQERAPSFFGLARAKTRIHQNCAFSVAHYPHKIIHRHRFIMRILRDEIFTTRALGHCAVTQGKDLVLGQCHDFSDLYLVITLRFDFGFGAHPVSRRLADNALDTSQAKRRQSRPRDYAI